MSPPRTLIIPAAVVAGFVAGEALAAEPEDEHRPDTVTIEGQRNRSVNLNDIAYTGSRLGLRHVSDRWANKNNSIKADAYTTLDAALTFRMNQIVATLRGRNLTDEQYTSGSSALMPRLAEPRSAELTLKYDF